VDDETRVRELLGREPQGDFEVVARDDDGDPVVIRNAPLLHDGTPMPTRYWLVGPDEVRRVGQLEAAGGVRAAESEVDTDELHRAHLRYASERDAELPVDHAGPRPSGGVGGTRTGVKCLHAHYAWHLAGGDDPVGRWVAERLARADALRVLFDDGSITVERGDRWREELPIGPAQLLAGPLAGNDPPDPVQLTNALGIIEDHLDEVRRRHPELVAADGVRCSGTAASVIVQVEVGHHEPPDEFVLERDAAEDVFRTVVTEPRADRIHNPGLPPEHVDTVVAWACVMVSVMRRFHLESLIVERGR
jgi:uncharacterized protein